MILRTFVVCCLLDCRLLDAPSFGTTSSVDGSTSQRDPANADESLTLEQFENAFPNLEDSPGFPDNLDFEKWYVRNQIKVER